MTERWPILEREFELEQFDLHMDRALESRGQFVIVEGAAGIGKTALLEAIGERARERDALVLSASGGELEVDLPFTVVRQLFDSYLLGLSVETRSQLLAGAAEFASVPLGLAGGAGGADPGAALHGLYWLLANIADRQPTVLLIDDAQWADTESLRWLSYLARRIGELRVLGVGAERSARETPGPLSVAWRIPASEMLQLRPLRPSAVSDLVAHAYDKTPDEAFCRACHELTGGNPFLVRELLHTALRDGIAPSSANAQTIGGLGIATVARSVLVRVARLGPAAVALARAVAVLSSSARIRVAAEVAGLPQHEAVTAAETLQGNGILSAQDQLEFTNPLVRSAIYDELVPAARSRLHLAAANALRELNAPVAQIATHLLSSEPAGEPWEVSTLVRAGGEALAQGSPDVAVTYLRHALKQTPAAESAGVLLALCAAEVGMQDRACLEHAEAAFRLADSPTQQGIAAIALWQAKMWAGDASEANAVAVAGLERVGEADRDLALTLRALSLGALVNARRPAPVDRETSALVRDLSGTTPAERGLISVVAWCETIANTPARDVAALSMRALVDDRQSIDGADPFVVTLPAVVLFYAGHIGHAVELTHGLLSDCQHIGSRLLFGWGSAVVSVFQVVQGDLAGAELSARDALAAAEEEGFKPLVVPALASLVSALVERGELAEADRMLASIELPAGLEGTGAMSFLDRARGTLALASHRHEDALAAFGAARDAMLAIDCRNPAIVPWRSDIALLLDAAGDRHAAAQLAREEVELARGFGAPPALGVAVRTEGVVTRDIELLRFSAEILSGSEARLEHARSLVEYGAALRRAKNRSASRKPLREGLDLAERCGASALARRALDELRATGARPRRHLLSGSDSLTASERRIARLAAEGRSNVEIAQALFVTRKTVEKHLGSAYLKLGINSRDQLHAVLGPE